MPRFSSSARSILKPEKLLRKQVRVGERAHRAHYIGKRTQDVRGALKGVRTGPTDDQIASGWRGERRDYRPDSQERVGTDRRTTIVAHHNRVSACRRGQNIGY